VRRFHLVAMVAWALLAVPMCLWWRDSVFFVALISVYANFIGHWSAWQAARAEHASRN
jgi:hypothetical protein